ncbi:MAG: hypothetical protein ACXWK6_04530 [Myxococcaceae bacterium]
MKYAVGTSATQISQRYSGRCRHTRTIPRAPNQAMSGESVKSATAGQKKRFWARYPAEVQRATPSATQPLWKLSM